MIDFASSGTNDLVQYTYAVDRTNARVRERVKPLGTATLRLVAQICRAGVPVAVCGQLAGDADPEQFFSVVTENNVYISDAMEFAQVFFLLTTF